MTEKEQLAILTESRATMSRLLALVEQLHQENKRLQRENERLVVYAACRAGTVTAKQFVEFCEMDWQDDGAWSWFEGIGVEYGKRGKALVEERSKQG